MCDSQAIVVHSLSASQRDAVHTILNHHPWELAEQQQRQLVDGATGFIGILNEDHQTYAHIRITGQADPAAVIEITSATQHPDTYRQAVAHALTQARAATAGPIHLWRHQPFPVDLTGLGLTLTRRLAHMQRPASHLPPIPPTPEGVLIRTFTPDDLEAFVILNNAAFTDHPDQGGWTTRLAQDRIAQSWVDLSEFYLAEDLTPGHEGELLAFHWTKRHTSQDGTLAGEVYVIGVHPQAQGRGLGKYLLLHGLHALARGGAQILDLWVDEADTAPYTLYQSMGFAPVHRSYCYVA